MPRYTVHFRNSVNGIEFSQSSEDDSVEALCAKFHQTSPHLQILTIENEEDGSSISPPLSTSSENDENVSQGKGTKSIKNRIGRLGKNLMKWFPVIGCFLLGIYLYVESVLKGQQGVLVFGLSLFVFSSVLILLATYFTHKALRKFEKDSATARLGCYTHQSDYKETDEQATWTEHYATYPVTVSRPKTGSVTVHAMCPHCSNVVEIVICSDRRVLFYRGLGALFLIGVGLNWFAFFTLPAIGVDISEGSGIWWLVGVFVSLGCLFAFFGVVMSEIEYCLGQSSDNETEAGKHKFFKL